MALRTRYVAKRIVASLPWHISILELTLRLCAIRNSWFTIRGSLSKNASSSSGLSRFVLYYYFITIHGDPIVLDRVEKLIYSAGKSRVRIRRIFSPRYLRKTTRIVNRRNMRSLVSASSITFPPSIEIACPQWQHAIETGDRKQRWIINTPGSVSSLRVQV